MQGYGVELNAPRPPFVFLKVLYRGLAVESLLAPLFVLWRLMVKIVGWIVGYFVGFVFGGGDEPKQPMSTGPAWEPDLSMGGDEYL